MQMEVLSRETITLDFWNLKTIVALYALSLSTVLLTWTINIYGESMGQFVGFFTLGVTSSWLILHWNKRILFATISRE